MSLATAGICAAVVTPLSAGRDPDAHRAVAYYEQLLQDGCDALNILGTTGEAMSFSAAQRAAFLQELIALGFPGDCAMAGTGSAALADAIELTRVTLAAGYAGALIMPPFFYRGISEDAVLHYFDALFAAVSPAPLSIYLYHFPQVSGVPFTVSLVDRLMAEFPDIIAGLKDSSNDLEYELALAARHPQLRIFPSSESHLLFARRHNLAGCISGTVALWAPRARALWADPQAAEEEQRAIASLREAVAGPDLIAKVRARTAAALGEAAWRQPVPPLQALAAE